MRETHPAWLLFLHPAGLLEVCREHENSVQPSPQTGLTWGQWRIKVPGGPWASHLNCSLDVPPLCKMLARAHLGL